MLKWNYESEQKISTGYEELLGKLKLYTSEKYKVATEQEKEVMVNEVFAMYRGKNIFPIKYYNEKGIHKEIQKCIDKEVSFDGKVLDLKCNQGSSLCKFLFPNLMEVNIRYRNNNNMVDRFYDDHKLKRAIALSLSIKNSVTPTEIRSSIELIGGNVATNYKSMNAKALYEKYCPKNGVIYDFACGFGGRMLGALSSKNNYTYIGVEPCIETYVHLNELGLHIEHVTNRKNSFKLLCMGSEDFVGEENSIDFSFSSPPYFNLEKYSDEPTQCYNKFSELEEWFNGYVRPTIQNTYKMLKEGSYYAVNIADFKLGKNEVKFVDRWVEIAEEYGFTYVEQIHMKLQTRKGIGHQDEEGNDRIKKEGIFIFKK